VQLGIEKQKQTVQTIWARTADGRRPSATADGGAQATAVTVKTGHQPPAVGPDARRHSETASAGHKVMVHAATGYLGARCRRPAPWATANGAAEEGHKRRRRPSKRAGGHQSSAPMPADTASTGYV